MFAEQDTISLVVSIFATRAPSDVPISLQIKLLRLCLADPSGLTIDDAQEKTVTGCQIPDWAIAAAFLTQDMEDAVLLGFRCTESCC